MIAPVNTGGITLFRRVFRDLASFYARNWWYVALVQLVAGLIVAFPLYLLMQATGLYVAAQGVDLFASGAVGGFVFALLALCLIVVAPLSMVGVGVTVRITNDALAGRKRRLWASVLESFRSIPALLASVLVALVGGTALIVLAPVLTAVGIVGLIASAAIALIRHARPRFASKWPNVRVVLWVATPFAPAVRFLAAALLAVPAVLLEKLTPIEAVRAGADASRGRRLRVVAVVLASVIVSFALQAGAAGLGSLIGDTVGVLVGQVAVQLLLVGLPVVVVTVLLRLGRAESSIGSLPPVPAEPYATRDSLLPRRARPRSAAPSAPALVRRVAVALPFILIVSAVGLAPTAAQAAGSSAGVTITVNTASDTTDAAELAAQVDQCASGSGTCSLRAALMQASIESGGSAADVAIDFADAYSISLAGSALDFGDPTGGGEGPIEIPGEGEGPSADDVSPNAESPSDAETPSETPSEPSDGDEGPRGGTISVDGGTRGVTIDAHGASQVLTFHSNSWGLALSHLRISNGVVGGYDALGGGVSITTPATSSIDSVTFDGNTAAVGGGAVAAINGTLTITNSTFVGNTATTGTVSDYVVGGGDVYALYSAQVTVESSTFAGYTGDSLLSAGSSASTRVSNSLFDVRGALSVRACSGQNFSGDSNVVVGTDTSCPGTVSTSGPALADLRVPTTGGLPVMALVQSASNGAIGAAGTGDTACVGEDARGRTRPEVGCDAGALQLDTATSTGLASSSSPVDFGTDVTFTTTVAPTDAASIVNNGSVSFSVDGIELGDPVAVRAGRATLTTRFVDTSGTRSVVATFVPANSALLSGSASAPFAQEVVSASSGTGLTSSANPSKSGSDATVTATVLPNNPRVEPTGQISLRDRTAGSPGTLIGTATLVAGTATFSLGQLTAGRHLLVAVYSGDAGNSPSESAILQQVVQDATAPVIAVSSTSTDFGRPIDVSVTIPTGSGLPTPTGQVFLAWKGGSHVVALDGSGVAHLQLIDIGVGTSDITADYRGDDFYSRATADPATVTVTAASTTTALAAPETLIYGAPARLTATVTRVDGAAPRGSVEFLDGTTVLGTAALTAGTGAAATAVLSPSGSQLAVGSHRLTARFVPDAGFVASESAAQTLPVTKASTATTLTSSNPSASVGTSVTLSAAVEARDGSLASPAGELEFFAGSTSLGVVQVTAGNATLTTAFASAGTRELTARFAGGDSFTGSTSSAVTQTTGAESVVTRLSVSPTASSRYGTALRLDVDVAGATNGLPGTGTVTVRDNGALVATIPLARGAGTATVSMPASGTHSYQARFAPANGDFSAGTSDAVVHSVDRAPTVTTLDVSTAHTSVGNPVTLTATVSSPSVAGAGSVTFTSYGTALGTAPLIGGVATLTTGLPQSADYPSGEREIVATYLPTDDFTASNASRFVAVARGTSELSIVLTGGRAGEPQSLVASVRVLTGTGVPTGRIVFLDDEGGIGVADLVDGVATLTGVVLPVGRQVISARMLSGDRDFDTPAEVTANFDVLRGTPSVALVSNATGAVTFGSSVTLTATVNAAGIPPTGTVRFVANGPTGQTELGQAGLMRYEPYTATLSTTLLPAGLQTITAVYVGDTNLNQATSAGISQEVGRTASRTTLTFPPNAVAGASSSLAATVSATGTAVGAGSVQFFRDGVSLGTAAVNGSGQAALAYTPPARGDAAFEARYSPASGDFTSSSATLNTTISGNFTSVTLSQPDLETFVGMPSHFLVAVTDGQAGLSAKPSGTVTVSDGAGNTCVINVSWDPARERSTGDCLITWTAAGGHTLRAEYSGDSLFAPSTSNAVAVTSSLRDAYLQLGARSALIIDQPTTLVWSVAGPVEGGTVQIRDGATTICTSTALSGTCDYTPTGGRTQVTLTMTYVNGSSVWAPKSTSLSLPLAGCVRLGTLTVSPSNAGSITVLTQPNCGSDGFLPGSYVQMQATPAIGWLLSKWSSQSPGLPDNLPTSWVKAEGARVYQTAYFAQECVSVTFSTIGLANNARELSDGITPNCGGWTGYGSDKRSISGLFQVGTVIALNAQNPRNPADGVVKVFSGWTDSVLPSGQSTAPRRDYVVTSDLAQEISAAFAVECIHDVTVIQPTGGTINLDGPTCSDFVGVGHPLGAQLSVSTKGTSSAYFAQWDGPVRQLTSAPDRSTGTFKVDRTNLPISATYRDCISFSATVSGYQSIGDSNPSTVKVSPTGTCPTKGAGWYIPGSRVQLETHGTHGTTFTGWTGDVDFAGSERNESTSIVLQKSGTADAKWFSEYFCKPFTLEARPAGALTVSAALAAGYNTSCPAGMLDVSLTRNGAQLLTLTAKANEGNPLIGWTGMSTRIGSDSLTRPIKIPASSSAVREVEIGAGGSFTAWACQMIDTKLTMISPNGTKNTSVLPSGTDYVVASPAPDCPLGTSAYTLGQTVFPQALGDDAGHTFVGWSGAVNSTDAYSAQGIPIDGASPTIALTATYQVKCFTLTTNTQHTQVMDAPNCPDTDASENKYIGGTTISLKTIGNAGSKVFRGFTGDKDGEDGIYAWLTITKDSAVYSNYETRSAGEAISDAFSDAGDAIAIAAKKAVGVVATLAATIAIGGNPLVAAMSLVVLIGEGISTITDAFGWETSGLTAFKSGISGLSQMVTFMQSYALCGSVWAANGSVKTVDDLEKTSSKKIGDYAKKVKEAKEALDESRAAQKAAQLAAIDAAGDSMAALKWASKAEETTSGASKAASALANKAKGAYEQASSAANKAGRLGDVAMIGYSLYSDYQSGNAGWDADAKSAWTTGGDVYMQCVENAVPDFIKEYDGK